MILGYEKIKKLLNKTTLDVKDRLIITPILEPGQQLKSGTASVDVRLGQRFRVPMRTKVASLDHLADDHEKQMERYRDEAFVRLGDFFVLHPRQFVLGETLEWIHLPSNLAADVVGRSSWARDGLVIATASAIHPNYSGIITLELTNIGEIPIHLYPGVSIAQLRILNVESPGRYKASTTTFAGSTEPRSSNPASIDKAVIKALKKRLDF